MGTNTRIEWADDTVNAWWGCTRVSPACEHCYAETFAKRVGRDVWGATAPRWLRVEAAIRDLEVSAARGDREGRPRRVFIASMSDVFEERHDLRDPRARLFDALHRLGSRISPLLLTKRPEFMVEEVQRLGLPAAAWVGVTVEDQRRADERIPWLLRVPAAVRFLSCEPLLGSIDLGLLGTIPKDIAPRYTATYEAIGWVIVGGESGPKARPMHPDWVRSLRDQCREAGVPFLFKQWGEWAPGNDEADPDRDVPLDWRQHPDRYRCLRPDGTLTTGYDGSGAEFVIRIGKHAAGRLLDGREWSEVPRG